MKGTYCLLISVAEGISPKVGALGRISFKKGNYVYVGSAQNSIESRVARHLSYKKRIRWHIDYLLKNKNVRINKILYKGTNKKEEECRTAKELMKNSEAIDRFGCSDCNCKSHLFRFTKFKKIRGFKELR